jgi:hypothetical protein
VITGDTTDLFSSTSTAFTYSTNTTGPANATVNANASVTLGGYNPVGLESAFVEVDFWRTFALSNAAPEWQILTGGQLRGLLLTQLSSGYAAVTANYFVLPGAFTGVSLGTPGRLAPLPFTRYFAPVVGGPSVDLNVTLTNNAIVPSGTYTVMGVLTVNALYAQSTGFGFAQSLFNDATIPRGLDVSIDAIPLFPAAGPGRGAVPPTDSSAVPEPRSLTHGLIAVALAGLAFVMRLRRIGPQSCRGV